MRVWHRLRGASWARLTHVSRKVCVCVCALKERERKRGRERGERERERGKDISKDEIILLRALRKKHFFRFFFLQTLNAVNLKQYLVQQPPCKFFPSQNELFCKLLNQVKSVSKFLMDVHKCISCHDIKKLLQWLAKFQ